MDFEDTVRGSGGRTIDKTRYRADRVRHESQLRDSGDSAHRVALVRFTVDAGLGDW